MSAVHEYQFQLHMVTLCLDVCSFKMCKYCHIVRVLSSFCHLITLRASSFYMISPQHLKYQYTTPCSTLQGLHGQYSRILLPRLKYKQVAGKGYQCQSLVPPWHPQADGVYAKIKQHCRTVGLFHQALRAAPTAFNTMSVCDCSCDSTSLGSNILLSKRCLRAPP